MGLEYASNGIITGFFNRYLEPPRRRIRTTSKQTPVYHTGSRDQSFFDPAMNALSSSPIVLLRSQESYSITFNVRSQHTP